MLFITKLSNYQIIKSIDYQIIILSNYQIVFPAYGIAGGLLLVAAGRLLGPFFKKGCKGSKKSERKGITAKISVKTLLF